MQISLTEKEITAGVVAALNARGFQLDPANISITYTQGRKANGLTALLVEGDVGGAQDVALVKKTHLVDNEIPLVQSTKGNADAPKDEPKADPVPAEEEKAAEPEPVVEEPKAEETAAAEPTTSLFQ